MKHLILNLILYSLVFIVVIACINIPLNKIVARDEYYKIDSAITTIILGHSHAEVAYADSLIKFTKNFAQSGESYFYTYVKLKKLIKANPGIQRVVLEVTNNNLDREMDKWTFDKMYVKYRYQKYAPILEKEELKLLAKNNIYSLTDAVAISIRSKTDFLRSNYKQYPAFSDWGGFKLRKESKVDSLLPIVKKQMSELKIKATASTELNLKFSEYNIRFLDSMVRFCKQQKLNIIFVRAPQHSIYHNLKADSVLYSFLSSHYSEIPFYNMGDLYLPNNYYLDFEHCNSKGAAVVSRKLDSLLNNQLKTGITF